jgi:hypothetical protein
LLLSGNRSPSNKTCSSQAGGKDPPAFNRARAEAEQLARDQEHRLAALIASIEPVPGDGNIDLATLYAGNLISGVVTATE